MRFRAAVSLNTLLYETKPFTMIFITITYKAKWQLKIDSRYKWTENKLLINTNTNRVIKKTLKGLTPGYWIGKKFIPLSEMKNLVEKITHNKLPF